MNYHLNQLKRSGKRRRVVRTKGGHWEVIDEATNNMKKLRKTQAVLNHAFVHVGLRLVLEAWDKWETGCLP